MKCSPAASRHYSENSTHIEGRVKFVLLWILSSVLRVLFVEKPLHFQKELSYIIFYLPVTLADVITFIL